MKDKAKERAHKTKLDKNDRKIEKYKKVRGSSQEVKCLNNRNSMRREKMS